MIGQRVEASAGSLVGAGLTFLVAAACLALAGYFRTPHPAVFAAMPLAISLAMLMTRQKPFAADLTPTGLEFDDPPLTVPYTAIDGLTTGRPPQRQRFAINIFHADGVIAVPERLTVPSRDLYAFLIAQLPASGSRDVNPALAPFVEQQETMFGPDRVFTYRARRHKAAHWRRRAIASGLAASCVGAAWVALGVVGHKPFEVWLGAGAALFFIGMFTLAAWLGWFQREAKGQGPASLAIAPTGLALVQGETRGELRWDELRNVNLRSKATSFQFEHTNQPRHGLLLSVEGATIVIIDLYDRPLSMIHERIVAYWRGAG